MKRLVILIGVLLVVSDAKKCSEITSESEDLYIKEITNDIEVTDE